MRRRFATAATVGAMLVGAVAATATPAQAYVTTSWKCRNIGAGDLCIRSVPNGWDAKYAKRSGNAVLVDFNLVCVNGTKAGWWGSDGAFWISAGETRTYTFGIGRDSNTACNVRLFDRNNGGWWETEVIYWGE
ncbi:hypothetical protein OG259_28945 [Streptomyces sp. NBC_00250]|uniref:hypothetical protein n=1 Tax=Streptomyces sp. NBC_00250 TaxID=2903641 RepID=UPI002E2AFEBB|nr:hypothetical protein [Streptomyces sp. NBC_00250]